MVSQSIQVGRLTHTEDGLSIHRNVCQAEKWHSAASVYSSGDRVAAVARRGASVAAPLLFGWDEGWSEGLVEIETREATPNRCMQRRPCLNEL